MTKFFIREFISYLAALSLILLIFSAESLSQTTIKSPLPDPTGYVNDYAGVIDQANKEKMEAILTNLNTRANIEFSVVTVKTTGDSEIFDYSLAVMRGWGIGSRDKGGLLLLVAIDDHKYFTQVSRHLEGDIPDGLAGETGRRMRDPFRAGQYGDGLMTAVQTYVATLAEKRGFSIDGIDQTYAYREKNQPRGSRSRGGLSSICGTIFLVLMVIIILALASRRRGGGGPGGGLGGALPWLALSMLLSSSRGSSSSGWSSGGFGGSSGGSGGWGGGGFGGFSGGGGDAGGGGAGGSW
ncbi:MAG: TPM domain-containing protein [Pyrinomonadaceae bacterium]